MSAQKEQPKQISTLGGFVAGAVAACGAVTVTNPIELVKTRMQLQGELAARGEGKKVYTSPLQALVKIYKSEGVKGLQSGLFSAYVYQIGLNGCRLGLYEPTRKTIAGVFHIDLDKENPIGLNVASGALSGIMGAVAGSPFYLIKTRQQSYSPAFKVGAQTYYKTIGDGFRQIYSAEGLKGLYRGVDAAILRTGAGSSVQLPIYNWAKELLLKHKVTEPGASTHLLASAMSGLGVAVVMNPWDVLMTRMYNQKGNMYKNPFDCLMKTVKIEGIFALYKGFGAHLLRIAPHTILTLMFMEQTMKTVKWFEGVPF